MRVAGIDCSSFKIDIVTVPLDEDEGEVQLHTFTLEKHERAFERTRSVPDVVPARNHSFWLEIIGCGLEEPTGRFKPGSGFRVQGAVLAMIPSRMLVKPLTPSEWRAGVGLPGNCSKQEVFDWVTEQIQGQPASQDAADAYCMALATRALILRDQEARVASIA